MDYETEVECFKLRLEIFRRETEKFKNFLHGLLSGKGPERNLNAIVESGCLERRSSEIKAEYLELKSRYSNIINLNGN